MPCRGSALFWDKKRIRVSTLDSGIAHTVRLATEEGRGLLIHTPALCHGASHHGGKESDEEKLGLHCGVQQVVARSDLLLS